MSIWNRLSVAKSTHQKQMWERAHLQFSTWFLYDLKISNNLFHSYFESGTVSVEYNEMNENTSGSAEIPRHTKQYLNRILLVNVMFLNTHAAITFVFVYDHWRTAAMFVNRIAQAISELDCRSRAIRTWLYSERFLTIYIPHLNFNLFSCVTWYLL
jgi:hypothetical protein